MVRFVLLLLKLYNGCGRFDGLFQKQKAGQGAVTMKILSIGNSFSQDAQKYLHYLAKSEGVDIQCQKFY